MKYTKTVLKNGVRVVTVPMADNPTVTVMVFVEAGSKYEKKSINGVSHFLEHLCFKGTDKRPTAFDITKELDGLGAQSNAFTGMEFTGYYAKAHKKHLPHLLDIISDLYLHPHLDAAEVEKEKGVIVDEISMYEDIPMRKVHDLFMRALYGDQPAGWSVAGEKEIVRDMTRDDILAYRKEHYVAQATTVVVAGGGFESKRIVKDVQKLFENISTGKKHGKLKTKAVQKEPLIVFEEKKSDQTHVVVGVRTFDLYHKDNPIVEVIAGILGRGMSSRLFQKLRDEMGVGYYVRAMNEVYTDHGALSISTGVNNDRVEEVLQAILAECRRLTTETVSDAELKKVKEFLTGNLMLGLESSDAIAEFYGSQEILREKIKEPKDLMKEIQAVTAKEVKTIAKKIFKNDRLALALIGPMNDSQTLKKTFVL